MNSIHIIVHCDNTSVRICLSSMCSREISIWSLVRSKHLSKYADDIMYIVHKTKQKNTILKNVF